MADRVAPPLEGDRRRRRDRRRRVYRSLDGARAARTRPLAAVALLEAREIGDGPSGRNGGFLHGYWSSLPRSATCSATGRRCSSRTHRAASSPLSGHLRAAARTSGYGRPGCCGGRPTEDEDDARRATVRARARGRRGGASRSSGRDVAGCESPRFRSGVLFRDGATVQPARLALALRRAALAAGVHLFERTPVTPSPGNARDPGRRRPSEGDRSRAQCLGHRLAPRRPPDELRQRCRPHRARARAARRDWLDGRRGDRRRAHVPPLLPHDARRTRADGKWLGLARARRQGRTRLLDDVPAQARAEAGLRDAPPRARRGAPSRRAGAGRSTSRPTGSRSSAPCRGRESTLAPATPATASARAGSAGKSSLPWHSASRTSGRCCPS